MTSYWTSLYWMRLLALSQAVEPVPTQTLLIIWKKIIAVVDTTFAIAKRKPEKSSYNHNFIIILSRVYNEPIQRASPFWLVSLINGALHRFPRGQGFESPEFFFRTAKLVSITALILYHAILYPAVLTYDFHTFIHELHKP